MLISSAITAKPAMTKAAVSPSTNATVSQAKADSLHFGANRTMKFPRYVQKQIDYLKDKLGLSSEEIVSLASGLMPAATYFPSTRAVPTFLMVAPSDLTSLNLTEKYPSEDPTADRHLSTTMSEKEFKTWQNNKAATLAPKQTFLQKLRAWVPFKSEVTFDDRSFRDTAEGAYNFIFSLFPLFTPFGIMNHLRVKSHDKKRVLNGIQLLVEATQRKEKRPSETLLSYTVSPQLDKDYKPINSPLKDFSLKQHNQAFAKFTPAKP